MNYKAAGDSDRTRTGIAAVFGNVDSYGDITHPGAFAKTLSEGRQRFKHFWNHDSSQPPIAKIIEIKEIGRSELPAEVLEYAPEATGGLLVKREYQDDAVAMRVLKGIDAGLINEMSFAFNIVKADDSEVDGKNIRNLRELALFDTSDVNFGANAATVAKNLFREMPLGAIIQQLQFLETEVKAGRRNSGADQILIDALHDISITLGSGKCGAPQEDTPKSDDADADAKHITSLHLLKLKRDALLLAAHHHQPTLGV